MTSLEVGLLVLLAVALMMIAGLMLMLSNQRREFASIFKSLMNSHAMMMEINKDQRAHYHEILGDDPKFIAQVWELRLSMQEPEKENGMSNYLFPGRDVNHDIFAGWDPPLNTFFLHVIDMLKDEEDRARDVVWLGTRPNEVHDIDVILQAARPYLTPEGLKELEQKLHREAAAA